MNLITNPESTFKTEYCIHFNKFVLQGFAVAVVSEDRTVSENKNVLALAGTTNNIAQSTNQDDIPTTYFRVKLKTLFISILFCLIKP